MGEHEPVDLLECRIGRPAAQGGTGPGDVGFDLVTGGFDLPPLVMQRREFRGRSRDHSGVQGGRTISAHLPQLLSGRLELPWLWCRSLPRLLPFMPDLLEFQVHV